MSVYPIFVVCAQALLAHVVFSQYAYPAPTNAPCGVLGSNGLAYGASLGYNAGLGSGLGCYSLGYGPALGAGLNYGIGPNTIGGIEVSPTSGGALTVSCYSPTALSGLTIASENVIEGNLVVSGELPFVGVIALDGAFPSGGAGVVDYSCGNGVTAIVGNGVTGGLGVSGVVPAVAGLGLGAASPGCGLLEARECSCRGF